MVIFVELVDGEECIFQKKNPKIQSKKLVKRAEDSYMGR